MRSLHTASRRIIELLVAEGIGTLVLGKNPFWKTKVELGKKHNQEFVQIVRLVQPKFVREGKAGKAS